MTSTSSKIDLVPSQESESLLRRLAGPSAGKAGLAKDQTEINRIISEASKGSKFYENEKKKDKEVTGRIEKMLKYRDEAFKSVDVAKVEASVDRLIAQLEEQRDLTQLIVHVDMDAFFANVELMDNPSLVGKTFAVVGKGVLTTASYEARKFGVRSGMAAFVAKKLCPHLILVENRHWRYGEVSDQIMEIFHRYDPEMCPAGCDEGYLNITRYCEEHLMTAEECVQEMRETVFRETKLTVSAGIAPNKMLAKICSDKNKPNGQYQLNFDPESIKTFMHDLPIRKIPGIGRVNERLLEAIGIKTCGDIYTQRAVISIMDKQFGLTYMLRKYLGISSNVVQAHTREERKSIGAERTFSTLEKLDDILAKLDEVATELEKDMEDDGWMGRTVTLKYKLDTYRVFTRAKSVSHWVSKKEELYAIGKELLLLECPLRLRLIGLRVTKLKDLRDNGESGIKRFFETVKDDSPRKRQKVEAGDDSEVVEDDHHGFHEYDEIEYQIVDVDDNEVVDITDLQERNILQRPVSGDHRPPDSENNATASSSKLETPMKRRRRSEDGGSPTGIKTEASKPSARYTEMHECPICGKTLETDNQGLNAHVDFCLSRGAIMKAQVEASKATTPVPENFSGWAKPESIKKKGEIRDAIRLKSKLTSKQRK